MADTEYRVYFQADDENVWHDLGVQVTQGQRSARRKAFEANGKKSGIYQAWPERSYDPKHGGLKVTEKYTESA
jgi:hypothetical protein